MSIASMTGFASASGELDTHSWIWEAKSVNGRSLDVRLRLPQGYERLELPARQIVGRKIRRGSVSLNLSIEARRTAGDLKINREFLDHLIDLHEELGARVASDALRLETLLTVRGVVEGTDESDSEEARQARAEAILETLSDAVDGLAVSRRSEGEHMLSLLLEHLGSLERYCEAASGVDAARIEEIQARLRSQVEELLGTPSAVSEERLAQEVALLATKADVREEIDRLRGHCASARDLLAQPEPVGRRLDFLCQELNREANTLCSKSPSEALTRIGLDFKATIDQFREQVQNVE